MSDEKNILSQTFMLPKKNLDQYRLQQILDCFVEITGIRAAYFDMNKECIIGKQKDSCRFCKLLRMIDYFDEACKQCDSEAFQKAIETKDIYQYKCHMGLVEAVIPLFVNNHLSGIIMLGQVKNEESLFHGRKIEQKIKAQNLPLDLLDKIKEAFDYLPVYEQEKLEAALKMFKIIAHYFENSGVIQVFDSDKVEKVKYYIRKHFREKISTRILAQYLGISISSLCIIFKEQTGKTVSEYIHRVRMDYAKELLAMTSLTIKEITALVGFEDQNYFSRVFKKMQGCSPVKYREQFKKLC